MLGFKTQRLRIPFQDWLGRKCELFAEAVFPEKENLPAILHCVGGSQQVTEADLYFWARHGFACISFDWQIGNLSNRPPDRISVWPEGVRHQSADIESVDQCIIPLAVQAARLCIDWLSTHPQVDGNRIGLSGISWGGYLSWLIAAGDPRVKALTPVYGCGIFQPDGQRRFQTTTSREVAERWRSQWDPQSLASKQQAPACYVSSTNDFFGFIDEADHLLNSLTAPHRRSFLPNCDHAISPSESALMVAWMKSFLNNGPALPAEPSLLPGLKLEADCSGDVLHEAIWWATADTRPDFRCWFEGTPPNGPEIVAFARVRYRQGFTLCSPLVRLPKTTSHPTSPPYALQAAGWRWGTSTTQPYDNDVRYSLSHGGVLELQPVPKPDNHKAEIILHQVSGCPLMLDFESQPAECSVNAYACYPDGKEHPCKILRSGPRLDIAWPGEAIEPPRVRLEFGPPRPSTLKLRQVQVRGEVSSEQ